MPSGLNATSQTTPVCPSRVWISLPVATSQTRTVPSSPAEARRRPSRRIATDRTRAVCPRRVRTDCPAGWSQIVRFASRPAETRYEPSGPKATDLGTSLTSRVRASCSLVAIPELDRAVPARGRQVHPVGAEGDVEDRAGVALDGAQQQPGGDVPEGRLTREAGGARTLPSRENARPSMMCGLKGSVRMRRRRAGGGVPELDPPLAGPGGEGLAVGADRQADEGRSHRP